jgi:hypothetical protein
MGSRSGDLTAKVEQAERETQKGRMKEGSRKEKTNK